ncbi:MAG: prenyltransferase [Anaerolineales bacterium]|nr:prenyltransferase [Anaerolineales bacterium]
MKGFTGPMRLPFVILTPACVLAGLGTAFWSTGEVNYLYFTLALIGAIAAHISVNAFNEYFDFKSGLDYRTHLTPFSGGSGTLPENPELARQALRVALAAIIITALIGSYFLWVRGIALLPLGALGLLTIVVYTPWFTRNPALCLIAPGLAFGPLMVMGTDFVLTGAYSWTSFFASLVPFFLVSDLLLLNQFPDVEADQSVGRRHFPIILGRRASSLIYGTMLILAYLSIVLGVTLGHLPPTSLIGLLTLLIAGPVIVGAYRHAESVEKLVPYMGLNVIINIATPVLVAIGLLIA